MTFMPVTGNSYTPFDSSLAGPGGGFDLSSIAGYGMPASGGMGSGLDVSALEAGLAKWNSGLGSMNFGDRMMAGAKDAGFGFNMPTFNLAVNGLNTLGNLWGGMKSLGLAKDQLNFSKAFSNANLANQTQAYNTQIADRARSRGFTEGNPGLVSDYIAQNSLKPRTVG